jgi:hypothetical protein
MEGELPFFRPESNSWELWFINITTTGFFFGDKPV